MNNAVKNVDIEKLLSYIEKTLAVPLKINATQEFTGPSKIIEIRYSN